MKLLGLGLLLAAFVVAPALAQKPDAPAPRKPAATKPAQTKPAAKPADTPQAKPTPKPAARPVVRRVAPPAMSPGMPYKVESIYQGDVPTDPARRPWQPPPRGQR